MQASVLLLVAVGDVGKHLLCTEIDQLKLSLLAHASIGVDEQLL